MHKLLRWLAPGLALTALGFMIALLLRWLFGVDWQLVSILILALAALVLLALSSLTGDHPPAWGGGRQTQWHIYTEMTARESAGGGPSGMSQPSTGWDRRAIANGVFLLGVVALLIVVQVFG